MTCYCIGVLEPLVADTPRVVAIDGGTDTMRIGVSDVAATGACAGLVVGWSDDFESQDPLSDSYTDINDCQAAAGVGVGGSWGVDPTGLAPAQYNCNFTFSLPVEAGRCGAVQFTTDHAAAADNGFGMFLFDVRDLNDNVGISLYHGVGVGADRSHLVLYDSDLNEVADVADVIVPGGFQVIRMDWQMSTVVGGVPQADGWVQVRVDTTLVIDETALELVTYPDLVNAEGVWQRVAFGPMGHGDNLYVWTE